MFLASINFDNYKVLSNENTSIAEIMDFSPEEEILFLIHAGDIDELTEDEARVLVATKLGI